MLHDEAKVANDEVVQINLQRRRVSKEAHDKVVDGDKLENNVMGSATAQMGSV
jgi:hypothetical protein